MDPTRLHVNFDEVVPHLLAEVAMEGPLIVSCTKAPAEPASNWTQLYILFLLRKSVRLDMKSFQKQSITGLRLLEEFELS